jgi:methylenetetrahydrofolate dehydrogenase (NADP+) / methenyltetrahydrofolate cyclohydrolase
MPDVVPVIPGEAVVMDGHRLLKEIVAGLRAEIDALGSPAICFATVLVGDDEASQRYAGWKHHHAIEAGMQWKHVGLPASATQAEVEAAVAALSSDPSVHGILVQLPLPGALRAGPILDLVRPEKDIDGLSTTSMGRLVRAEPGHVPCTAKAVMRLLARYGVRTDGQSAVVIGRSPLLGLPLALLLAREGVDATVTLADAQALDLATVCRRAQIVVSTAGVPRLVRAEWIQPGAAVVDAGGTRTAEGIVGDVDYDAVRLRAGAIAPMPGGTGPMTIACLLENTLDAARMLGVVAHR